MSCPCYKIRLLNYYLKFNPSFWTHLQQFFSFQRLLSSASCILQIVNDKNNHILATKTFRSTISWLIFIIIIRFFLLFWKMGSTKIAQMRFVFLFNNKYKKVMKIKYFFIEFFEWLTSIVSRLCFAYYHHETFVFVNFLKFCAQHEYHVINALDLGPIKVTAQYQWFCNKFSMIISSWAELFFLLLKNIFWILNRIAWVLCSKNCLILFQLFVG